MRLRPDARPDQLPPPERRIHTVFNGTAHCASRKAPTDRDHETQRAGRDQLTSTRQQPMQEIVLVVKKEKEKEKIV